MKSPAFTRPQATELTRRLKEPRRFIQSISGARQIGQTGAHRRLESNSRARPECLPVYERASVAELIRGQRIMSELDGAHDSPGLIDMQVKTCFNTRYNVDSINLFFIEETPE